MESLQLERNGQLLERDYGCNKVRSRPRWKSANEVDLAQYARQAPRR
jgi:hypothetical protein